MWPEIIRRDQGTCQMPHCRILAWLAKPRPCDRLIAAQAAAWLATQGNPRAVWINAPTLIGPRGGRRMHPLSPSVDMILPLSQGGNDRDPTNCRLTHLHCNISRGDGRRGRRHPGMSSVPRIVS